MFHTDEYEYLFHEIKNDVCLVGGSLQLIAKQHPEVHKFRYWDDVVTDVSHLLGMCREISATGSHNTIQTEPVDPSAFFKEVQQSAISLLGERTTCILVTEESLPMLSIDRIRMRHALINLIKNSAEAIETRSHMSEGSSSLNTLDNTVAGEITISVALTSTATIASKTGLANTAGTTVTAATKTAASTTTETIVTTHTATEQSNLLHIQVQDNGCGIPQESIDRIFLPSYTNKPGGTGLGLAITKQIIEAHHGTISCKSVLGTGTVFSIYLPIQDRVSQAELSHCC